MSVFYFLLLNNNSLLWIETSKTKEVIILIFLLVGFFLFWILTGISPKQRLQKIKLVTQLIKKENRELFVSIESIGKLPVDIMAPEIKFYNKKKSRTFAIKSNRHNTFPVYLLPETSYEFKIDFNAFYYKDLGLVHFRKVKLIIRDKSGRLLKSKKFHL